jgi:hypothetical protein
MGLNKNINIDNLYSDLINRIKLLYTEFKNSKEVVYEYFRRLILDVSNSMSGKVRKDVLKLVEGSKSGILDLKSELVKYLKNNKNLINKYSFESTYSFIKKIEKVRNDYTKMFLPAINKIIVRLTNLEFSDKSKFKKAINNFYFICNNYIKIILNNDKSEYVMGWLLSKVNPQN